MATLHDLRQVVLGRPAATRLAGVDVGLLQPALRRRGFGETSVKNPMTQQEQDVMNHLVRAWQIYVNLPRQHDDDVTEFRHALHRLQHLLLVRQARPKQRESGFTGVTGD
jgi:hypothetical protein